MLEVSDKQLREDMLQKLVDQRLMGGTSQISLNADPSKLAMRSLPHQSWANLYVMYVAFCRMMKEEPAGKSLFYQTSVEWRGCIKFHKKCTHQICKICSELRAAIENAKETCILLLTTLSCVFVMLS